MPHMHAKVRHGVSYHVLVICQTQLLLYGIRLCLMKQTITAIAMSQMNVIATPRISFLPSYHYSACALSLSIPRCQVIASDS